MMLFLYHDLSNFCNFVIILSQLLVNGNNPIFEQNHTLLSISRSILNELPWSRHKVELIFKVINQNKAKKSYVLSKTVHFQQYLDQFFWIALKSSKWGVKIFHTLNLVVGVCFVFLINAISSKKEIKGVQCLFNFMTFWQFFIDKFLNDSM